MAKCIIIDDETRARELLKNIIADTCPEVAVVALCDDLPSGVKAIKKYHPDLILLDIEMPGHSGLEILDYFEEEEVNFDIIFCTGYSEYAIQAFKLSAIDYLLKPISPDALVAAIARFHQKSRQKQLVQFKALKDNISNNPGDKCLVVNMVNNTRFIKVKDILMLKAEGSYCELFLTNGEKLMTSKNLKHYEERLYGLPLFFRCHKSYIINLKAVKGYNKSDNQIFLENNQSAMLSVDKTDTFITKMEQLI